MNERVVNDILARRAGFDSLNPIDTDPHNAGNADDVRISQQADTSFQPMLFSDFIINAGVCRD